MSIIFHQLPLESLTQEQANECARRIQKNKKDHKAIETMVTLSLREAVLFLRDLCHRRIDDGELVSIAYKALERSARSYRPDRGHRFFYFAKKALRGVLIEHWRSLEVVKHGSFSVSMEVAEDILTPRNKHPDLMDPEATGSLEGKVEFDFDDTHTSERLGQIRAAMRCLTKFERALVLFIYHTGFSFQEAAEEFGCSRAWAGICWNRAIEKLRVVLVK